MLSEMKASENCFLILSSKNGFGIGFKATMLKGILVRTQERRNGFVWLSFKFICISLNIILATR